MIYIELYVIISLLVYSFIIVLVIIPGSVALELQQSTRNGPTSSEAETGDKPDGQTASGSVRLELPPGMSMSALRKKRPSIAPVPAMLDNTDGDDEEECNKSSDGNTTPYMSTFNWNKSEPK